MHAMFNVHLNITLKITNVSVAPQDVLNAHQQQDVHHVLAITVSTISIATLHVLR
jgi:hypothetical protein